MEPIKPRQISRAPSSAGAKVTVACKLPNGLMLQADRMIPSRELVMGGGSREVMVAEKVGLPIQVHGTATSFGEMPKCRVVGGYALTPGVDKELWDQWLKSNENSAMVKNHLIFAYESMDDVEGQAKEQAEVRSGLEPFAKDKDPRAPRAPSNLTAVGEEEGRARAA